jgi:putative endonuclease
LTPFEDFQDQVHTSARGSSAEHDAVDWLQRNGYSIVERNVRFTFGEIDLIAFDGDTLCFVEIKARASRRFGGASFAVPKAKQRQLVRLAGLYLARSAHTGPCRFDVLAMDGGEGGWQFTLFSNAFEAL